MSYGDPYATVEELEARLNSTEPVGSGDLSEFERILDAASRAVEAFTGRQFNRDVEGEEPTTRRYRPVDPERVAVDDFYTLDDLVVEVNGSPWEVTDVDARPWNGIYRGEMGWPFFDLFAVSPKLWPPSWPRNRRPSVTVTAHWGWASVPEAIRLATLDVAAVMIRNSDVSGVIQSETIADYSVTFADRGSGSGSDVPVELQRAVPYRRIRFGVA